MMWHKQQCVTRLTVHHESSLSFSFLSCLFIHFIPLYPSPSSSPLFWSCFFSIYLSSFTFYSLIFLSTSMLFFIFILLPLLPLHPPLLSLPSSSPISLCCLFYLFSFSFLPNYPLAFLCKFIYVFFFLHPFKSFHSYFSILLYHFYFIFHILYPFILCPFIIHLYSCLKKIGVLFLLFPNIFPCFSFPILSFSMLRLFPSRLSVTFFLVLFFFSFLYSALYSLPPLRFNFSHTPSIRLPLSSPSWFSFLFKASTGYFLQSSPRWEGSELLLLSQVCLSSRVLWCRREGKVLVLVKYVNK